MRLFNKYYRRQTKLKEKDFDFEVDYCGIENEIKNEALDKTVLKKPTSQKYKPKDFTKLRT